MSNIAIKFENVSKQYRLGVVGTGTISHDLNRWWHLVRGKEDPYLKVGEVNDRSSKAISKYVWALKDINFEVEQGDVVGIIGRNGAGKSTLLKLLSRVTTPSTGMIKAKGRIASLLEVGTGFHPELTGRENIYMNGTIMGMTKHEITRKLDEIIDFAGVEKYIDTPAKRYSSGMTVRLGFAIAAHLEPEILIVDEVLAVGDAEFQKKAIGKMQDVSKGEGRTVLFVSHNMTSIRNLCKTGIYLENGRFKYTGEIEDCVSQYLKSNEKENNLLYENKNIDAYIKRLRISSTKTYISTGHDFSIELLIDLKKFRSLNIDYGIYKNEELITIISSKCSEKGAIDRDTSICIVNKNPLIEGTYYVNVFLYDDKGYRIEFLEKCLQFDVINGDFYVNNELPKVAFRSKFLLDYNWK